MTFNICVAIPVKSAEIEVNRTIIDNVLNTNPELIEFRLDYIDDIVNITPDLLISLLNLAGPDVKSIFTFRNPNEGGQKNISDIERLKIVSMFHYPA